MKPWIVAMLLLLLPFHAWAKEKQHVKTSGDQECSVCHGAQAKVWFDGKHGLMNVPCVVCHGSPEKNFVAKPGISRCGGCHGERVADVERRLPKDLRDCFLCHEPHTVKARFHGEGGRR